MYLASTLHGVLRTYQIRQSYLNQDTAQYRSRTIFDLGTSPTDYFELYEDEIPFFTSELEQAVASHTSQDSTTILEELLWNFFPRECRERLSRFKRGSYDIPGPLTSQDKQAIATQIHLFDRRRLYYLYYGAIDQSRLWRMREKVCRPLLDICRDEREYRFRDMEMALKPGEYRNYVYAIFDLQRHFSQSFAAYLPEAMPEDEVADYFVQRICTLNDDMTFWQGEPTTDALHQHLVRYLILYFDYVPIDRSLGSEYVRRFMRDHRKFSWPRQDLKIPKEKIEEIFGQNSTELKQMSRRELRRLYRAKALELHPDQGGDQERFVELTTAYTMLLKSKE